MRNSFILVEEEKKRIRKLYEATSASASGAFEQPMAWTDTTEVTIEPVELGGDNIVDGSEEISIDFDEISDLLGLSEEEQEERIRKTQEENYIISKKDK
jgi:hypothetical protein